MTKALSIIPRYSIYALLIFTPLATRHAPSAMLARWGGIVTLIALTTFLLEKAWTWNWKWISTPLDNKWKLLL